ncbi:Uncharacterized protein APZ42_026359 [Daphnia magna]|uniref:Uncharacterized protein n=1 Tax=Daphnia magna TaxID=35525 RepID=A0A164SCW4_9CRUS|nr:Uncharacterized protein APZ42_026359 [Daphnia magna]
MIRCHQIRKRRKKESALYLTHFKEEEEKWLLQTGFDVRHMRNKSEKSCHLLRSMFLMAFEISCAPSHGVAHYE